MVILKEMDAIRVELLPMVSFQDEFGEGKTYKELSYSNFIAFKSELEQGLKVSDEEKLWELRRNWCVYRRVFWIDIVWYIQYTSISQYPIITDIINYFNQSQIKHL